MTTERSLGDLARAVAFAALAAPTAVACSIRSVDPDTLPTELRASYALFESRCSKCHTIARPLNAPVNDATHWELYVARMRRTPGSGISERDASEILRFLVYYTAVIRGEGDESRGVDEAPEAPIPPTEGERSRDETTAEPTTEGIVFDEEGDDADLDR